MSRLIVDPELCAKLGDFQDLVEFCDESGRVVGFFHPTAPMGDACKQQIISPISDKDIETARGQRTGRPLPQIFADLDRQT